MGNPHPQWEQILEHRFVPDTPEPEGWDEAVTHLDECLDCRARAVEIDPTLAFRRLPTVEVDAAEIEAMQHSVRLLRRGREVAGVSLETAAVAHARQGRGRRWWLPAAAALAVGMGLGMVGGGPPSTAGSDLGIAASTPTLRPINAPAGFRGFGNLDAMDGMEELNDPVLEGVESPEARVYQFRANTGVVEGETIAVAFVFDPTIDV